MKHLVTDRVKPSFVIFLRPSECPEVKNYLITYLLARGCLSTSLITSSQPLMLLLAVFVYDPLTWMNRLTVPRCRRIARTAVGLFITLARQSGTGCQMNLEILTVLLALNNSWKQLFSAVTSVTSAQEVSNEMRYLRFTYLLTYLLT